jgi:hypothetical protein|tara:strand:- start:2476 stop:2676 length:201 start_codon:yes stop_codon:yes gene_type:complete
MKHKSMSQMNKERKQKSVFKDKTISNEYKRGGAYKAMLDMFADHLSDQEYAEHCRKFFKGDNENNS